MVNSNSQILPVEEVRYLDTEIPSFEEFMRNYKSDEAVENSYINEMNGCGDSRIEKGYGPCSYSPYEVNPHKIAGKHINMCGSLGCNYYCRITGNRVGGTAGVAASVGAGIGFWAALAATPFTGGASLLVATGLSAAASASVVGGTVLTGACLTEVLNGIENELKLKWEEKREALQKELNRLEEDLKEATKRRDRCKSYSDYEREQRRVRELEDRIEKVKRDLHD